MLPSARWTRAALLLVVAMLAALVATGVSQPAQAADDKGLANGAIKFPQHDGPSLKMLWFDKNWKYIGQRTIGRADGYSIWLDPGTYHLQFVDQRPSYDVTKYAPSDVQVTVRANDISTRSVTMVKGAAITGVATARGKPLAGARLVAANRAQQSFETTADKRGQFAIGGLPQGKYSVFTFDKRKDWVGKSTYAGNLRPGRSKNLPIRLATRAGSMTVYLFTPDGRLRTRASVTVTNNKTGQWWTATARNGTAVFKGLYPGGYRLKFDGAGVWFARTAAVQRATVKPGRMAFGKFSITKRGGWITGTLVDRGAPDIVLSPPFGGSKAAQVTLFDKSGTKLAVTTSDDGGNFKLTGALATQSGLTITVDPGIDSGGYMNGEGYCQFDHAEFVGLSVTTGEETYVGDLLVPRTPGQDNPRCASDDAGRHRR
jgi:hypothetical protein